MQLTKAIRVVLVVGATCFVNLQAALAAPAATIFSVATYGAEGDGKTLDSPSIRIEARNAGHIHNAKDWNFSDITFEVADGSAVELTDDLNVTGLPSGRQVSPQMPVDTAKKTFADQDRSL